jgi:hypothetical protein
VRSIVTIQNIRLFTFDWVCAAYKNSTVAMLSSGYGDTADNKTGQAIFHGLPHICNRICR